MDNNHSITDELRKFTPEINGYKLMRPCDEKELLAIADRIDEAHEEALREAYTKGLEDGMGVANRADMRAEYLRGKNDGYDEGYDAGFASADDWCAQNEDAMAKHGWVRLPKDADGEYIHVGDMLVDGLSQGFAPKKVKMLMLEENEWMLNFGGGWCSMKNHEWHHHAPDTWERIIKDAMMGADRDGAPDTYQGCLDELVARCKALAGGNALWR